MRPSQPPNPVRVVIADDAATARLSLKAAVEGDGTLVVVGEARRRQLSLQLHLQGAPVSVQGDTVALERVFANLLQNALKFTPASGQVTISLVRQNALAVATVEIGRAHVLNSSHRT
mgnify:CR=1 FL=1